MSATQRWNIGVTHEGGGEVVNPDYLVFGYWQMRSSSGDRSFISFFDGGENWNVGGGVDTITGTAEYRGPAAGRYVTGLQTAPFTASAALTADFGDPSNGGEVTGTISEFTDGRGGMPLSSLEIRLDAGTISDGLMLGTTSAHRNGGPLHGGLGEWTAQFFGNDAADADKPTGVAGGFTFVHPDSLTAVAGGFAAVKQP